MIFIPVVLAKIRDSKYTKSILQSSHSNKILKWLEENVSVKLYSLELSTQIWFGEVHNKAIILN
jgi:hypothetical protein